MHGHTFKITLTLVGMTDPQIGWVRDYHEIAKTMEPLIKMLDHQILNEVPGLANPTSENLAVWIFEKAKLLVPELTRVTIAETPTTECSYPA
jgi:6-pyruvoyltetrahydropterin/6-carboxytetrahydropterin synthase